MKRVPLFCSFQVYARIGWKIFASIDPANDMFGKIASNKTLWSENPLVDVQKWSVCIHQQMKYEASNGVVFFRRLDDANTGFVV